MPSDRALPPTPQQRWLVRHAAAVKALTAALAVLAVAWAASQTLAAGTDNNWWPWLSAFGLVGSAVSIWRNISALRRHQEQYDRRLAKPLADG